MAPGDFKGIWEHYPDGTPYPGYVDATDTGGRGDRPGGCHDGH